MKRREFITLLGGAAAMPSILLASSAWGQQATLPVVGVLVAYALDQSGRRLLAAFGEGLKQNGYEDGKNVTIDYHTADGHYDRLPGLAADLVRRRSTVIAAVGGSPAALAAKRATASIPIVFQIGVDPVQAGLVESLNRPGGNITGIANLSVDLGPKRLQVLHELIPKANLLTALINPARSDVSAETRELQAAAKLLGTKLQIMHASTEQELDKVFADLAKAQVDGLVISGDPFFNSRSTQLASLAMRHAMPAVYQYREFVAEGGLISYGSSIVEAHRLAGIYAGRILKGEKPADLPIQQSSKIELIVNLKTAKAIGLTVPTSLLLRADEVIE